MRSPARRLSPLALAFLLLVGLALACSGEKLPTEQEKVIPPPPDTAVYRDVSSTHLPEVVKAPGQRSMEARAVDVDADGDLDLIVACEAQPNVLLLNDGQGRFSNASGRIPQVALDSEDIAVGDFDRDGDPDVVIVTEDPVGGVRYNEYYLNDGQGSFSDVHTRLPPTIESNAVAAADIDHDGDLDLVVGDRGRGARADERRARLLQRRVGHAAPGGTRRRHAGRDARRRGRRRGPGPGGGQ